VRLAAAFLLLFLGTLIVTAVVGFLVGRLVDLSGLSATDRTLGLAFGLGRGVALVAILVLLAGFTSLPRDPWWRQSVLLPHFQDLALWLRGFLPPEIAARVAYR
jgi:membrane protein required for colicin V production